MGRGSSKAGGGSNGGGITTKVGLYDVKPGMTSSDIPINPNKEFSKTDYTTWKRGTTVDWLDEYDGKTVMASGKVTQLNKERKSLIVETNDGMRLMVDKDTAYMFKAKKQ